MTFRSAVFTVSLCATAGLLVAVTTAQDVPVPNPPLTDADKDKDIQVQNQGPVHEAFANPGAAIRGKDNAFADKAPPPPVPELPPDEKPAGDNVQWISGYWQWDAQKNDFIWVSGLWRNIPPGRAWQAGQWKVENGKHRYIPGFWKPTGDNALGRTNLPEPPKSVENGPNVPAPHKDAVWIPGHWVHKDEKYGWRPGYWGEGEDNYLWTPGEYVYTGDGYCYNPGHWDYCLEDRGLLYAPVCFGSPLWLNAGWRFCPRFAINIGIGAGWGWGYGGGFYNSLFIGPGYGSFWFGNYYGPGFWGAGYRPWCWGGGGGYHNCFYSQHCWQNRGNPGWNVGIQAGFAARNMGIAPGLGVNVGVAYNWSNKSNNNNFNNHPGNNNLVSKAGANPKNLGNFAGNPKVANTTARTTGSNSANLLSKQTGNMIQPAGQVIRNQNTVRLSNGGNTTAGNISSARVQLPGSGMSRLSGNNDVMSGSKLDGISTRSFNSSSSGSSTTSRSFNPSSSGSSSRSFSPPSGSSGGFRGGNFGGGGGGGGGGARGGKK